jgi:DNA (cytosine-5)-methyltransferase 1
MKHLGDITKIHGDQIEPVDCITFGSPCQDLSIAGRRAGLAGERSGLFMEAVRIIKEMRSSTNGLHPTFAIWENVPGAFSSNGGEDFRAVLEELARIEQPDVSIPRPSGRGGRWSKAGAISGDGWSLAWRQLDSQYFGVAQRRKRIALIIDLGGQRAGEVLFERTSLSRHPDPCIPTWQEVTGAAGSRIAGNDRPVPVLNDQGGGVMDASYNIIGTLRAAEHGHQPIVFESNAQPVVLESNQVHATATQTGICPTLSASMGMGGGYIPMVTNKAEKTIHWIVRRLTPVECERLQGYPDGWTDIGEWVDSKGKKHKYADSPRYKALGNSIALPQWFWIAQKMKPYLRPNATLGSLFDGIGGFPLVWQKTYGNGTARWASEIDEFPIAVTKRRFGEE